MLAAYSVGAFKILVLTGCGKGSFYLDREAWKDAEPDYIAENLLEAVQWLLNIDILSFWINLVLKYFIIDNLLF